MFTLSVCRCTLLLINLLLRFYYFPRGSLYSTMAQISSNWLLLMQLHSYARRLLDTLFSKEEQSKSLVQASSKSSKPPLDQERVTKMFGIVALQLSTVASHQQAGLTLITSFCQ